MCSDSGNNLKSNIGLVSNIIVLGAVVTSGTRASYSYMEASKREIKSL